MTWFTKDDGRRLPVDDRYLLPILSPTAPGTNYWDPPPPGKISDRQQGRVLLQIHQVIDMLSSFGVDLGGRRLCDIGTGNGLVPRLLLEFSDIAEAVGADPFLDGEHQTSWQPHDHDEALQGLRRFFAERMGGRFDIAAYGDLLGHENYSMRPGPVAVNRQNSKRYRFAQVGAHDLDRLDETFDLFYCKAIEHIPDWSGVFASMTKAARPGAVVYFKHRPFFSYLGPHRYASTMIPWGHALLTDTEFRRYARTHHAERADAMIEFFFEGLAYPRYSVSDMLRIARDHHWASVGIVIEPPRYLAKVQEFVGDVENFWGIQHENYPNVGSEELLSGMYHIVLRLKQ